MDGCGVLALILFGSAVHLPSLTGELLWDDIPLIKDNPLIRSPLLIPEAFRHYLFPDAYAGHYRPVQTISYIFDYLFWNKEAYGYHLSNVLWHVLSGVLLYYLLCRILESLLERWPDESFWKKRIGSSTAAFVLALLWVVHPVHSAAVDYVSGRADSLAFFFAASGWLLYLQSTGPIPVVEAQRLVCSGDAVGLALALFARKRWAVDAGVSCFTCSRSRESCVFERNFSS